MLRVPYRILNDILELTIHSDTIYNPDIASAHDPDADFDFLSNLRGFYRAFSTGVTCRQGRLLLQTPLVTSPCTKVRTIVTLVPTEQGR